MEVIEGEAAGGGTASTSHRPIVPNSHDRDDYGPDPLGWGREVSDRGPSSWREKYEPGADACSDVGQADRISDYAYDVPIQPPDVASCSIPPEVLNRYPR
jgi:hypothetical protein